MSCPVIEPTRGERGHRDGAQVKVTANECAGWDGAGGGSKEQTAAGQETANGLSPRVTDPQWVQKGSCKTLSIIRLGLIHQQWTEPGEGVLCKLDTS